MPLFKRFRPAPSPSPDAAFSLTLFDTSYHLRASSPQAQNLIHLTNQIASNVPEARRLLGLKISLLHPKDQAWMAGVITDNEAALHDIARLLRPARALARPAAAILEIPLFDPTSRSTWLLEDSRHVRALHQRLGALHGSLMSVLSVLYLRDLRWVFVETPEARERRSEGEAAAASSSSPPPAYDSIVTLSAYPAASQQVVDSKQQQQQHVQGGCGGGGGGDAQKSMPLPPTTGRFAIDNPYTWQPASSPPPPPGEKEKLQHSRSDPTPQQQAGHGHEDPDARPSSSLLYRHETIPSSYLRNCRLTTPWTTEFAIQAEEEGGSSSMRDDGKGNDDDDGLGLALPPRLCTQQAKRRWSSDVLRYRVCG